MNRIPKCLFIPVIVTASMSVGCGGQIPDDASATTAAAETQSVAATEAVAAAFCSEGQVKWSEP